MTAIFVIKLLKPMIHHLQISATSNGINVATLVVKEKSVLATFVTRTDPRFSWHLVRDSFAGV